MAGIEISVLLPLQEQRETGRACVEAWTRSQTLSRDRYEVVALAPGIDPALERDVRPLLAPQDRWIEHPTDSEYVLFNLGAREARGRFLFCTEAHCVPEPDCLETMLAELDRTGAPGARGRSIGIPHGPLGHLEMDEYERALRVEEEPDHWPKVLIHSLAIRRDVYLGAGGFPPRYGDFSPWALAIALRENGHRLIYTPRPAVRHSYTGELGELVSHVREFGRCEMRYCWDVPSHVRGRYLEEADEWNDRGSTTRAWALHALRAGLAARRRDLAFEVARHAAVALAGRRAAMAAGWVVVAARMSGVLAMPDGPRRVATYRELWQAASHLGRLEGLSELPGPPPSPPMPVPVDDALELDLTSADAPRT